MFLRYSTVIDGGKKKKEADLTVEELNVTELKKTKVMSIQSQMLWISGFLFEDSEEQTLSASHHIKYR